MRKKDENLNSEDSSISADSAQELSTIKGLDGLFEKIIKEKIKLSEGFDQSLPELGECQVKKNNSNQNSGLIANNLNAYEQNQIREVQKACSVFVDEHSIENVRPLKSMSECWGQPELYPRMTVQLCTQIAGFNQLNSHDQLLILKPFCWDVLMVRFAFQFDLEKNGFLIIEVRRCQL